MDGRFLVSNDAKKNSEEHFTVLNNDKNQHRIQSPVKIFFKIEHKMKTFLDIQKSTRFITNRLSL
jgi:hypothetical protein